MSRYNSAPNQEQIIFDIYSNREKRSNSAARVPFIYATTEDEKAAMRLLKGCGNAFLLWRYWLNNLSAEDDKSIHWISPQAIENDIGLSESMYKTAKAALIDKGFLTWHGNAWRLHNKPHEPQPKISEEQRKKNLDSIAELASFLERGYKVREPEKVNQSEPAKPARNSFEPEEFDGGDIDFDENSFDFW